MEIKPTYVTFEQAKLLKEKWFDLECLTLFNYEGAEQTWKDNKPRSNKKEVSDYIRPEQWQVVEWLRVNHSIHVFYLFEIETKKYSWEIWDDKKEKHHSYNSDSSKWDFNSPQEAYSAAFDYGLTKLI